MLTASTLRETFAAVGGQTAVGAQGVDGRLGARPFRPASVRSETSEQIVERARAVVLARLDRRLDGALLAQAVGVGERRLRRAVLAGSGLTLSAFVLAMRLDQARLWLSSNREARTQREIALALGFASGASFSRAYGRRFGESMSATRRRAVAGAVAVAVSGAAAEPRAEGDGSAVVDFSPCKSLCEQGFVKMTKL